MLNTNKSLECSLAAMSHFPVGSRLVPRPFSAGFGLALQRQRSGGWIDGKERDAVITAIGAVEEFPLG